MATGDPLIFNTSAGNRYPNVAGVNDVIDTITIPYTTGSISTATISTTGGYTIDPSFATNNKAVVSIPKDGDLKIGDRSLTEFMDRVEERLGILRPNEGLESRWAELKELRQRYQELEKELLEKEKIMDILKDKHGS